MLSQLYHTSESGQTTIEYGIVLMVVSIVVIGVLLLTAGSVLGLFQFAEGLVHDALSS